MRRDRENSKVVSILDKTIRELDKARNSIQKRSLLVGDTGLCGDKIVLSMEIQEGMKVIEYAIGELWLGYQEGCDKEYFVYMDGKKMPTPSVDSVVDSFGSFSEALEFLYNELS